MYSAVMAFMRQIVMHYRKSFLTNVIFRLDFEQIEELKKDTDITFSKEISEKYPLTSKEIPTSESIQKEKFYRRDYKNNENDQKAVYLFPDALVIEYKQGQYKHFTSFYKDVNFVYDAFQKSYNVATFKRMGLRYINEIVIPDATFLNWKGYIRSQLEEAINSEQSHDLKLVRSMHQLHLLKEEVSITFNYGILNKDYPNPISKPSTILDYDSYIVGEILSEDILKKLTNLNTIVSHLFNNDITEKLKRLMEETDAN